MKNTIDAFEPGQRVRIQQQIPQRDDVWVATFDAQVIKAEQRKTGSWFAHSKDDRLWLDRLIVRKDDGEVVYVILDQYTHVEVLEAPTDEADADDAASDHDKATTD